MLYSGAAALFAESEEGLDRMMDYFQNKIWGIVLKAYLSYTKEKSVLERDRMSCVIKDCMVEKWILWKSLGAWLYSPVRRVD